MIRPFTLPFAALAFATAATAENLTSTQDYTCNDGAPLSVAYINTPAGDAFAVLLIDGRMHIAEIAVSASGARYVTAPEDGYTWHEKRGEGLLEWARPGEDMPARTQICTETPQDTASD